MKTRTKRAFFIYSLTTIISVFSLLPFYLFGQGNIHQKSTTYEWPTDPLVLDKLNSWQDLKFGMIIHWGLYSVPGIIESWELCSEDWINRDSTMAYEDYKKWYWGLSSQFNPREFNPDQWAAAAKAAGMKYVVFTTKHHDGFSMFDTQQSNFKISAGPFASNPKADVARYVFDSFRKEGFMIGAYFSKPDWHSEYYWWPRYATADRNNNYDIRKNPWRWDKFKQYTFNQIGELVNNYGGIDILWLDGGWVRPLETVTDEVRAWGADIPEWSQEIDMPKIAAMARNAQPGLLIVDRTVHGAFENYQTPEQSIPKTKLNYPWESCITLGNAWGHVPNDNYKEAAQVIHLLIEVVAKGGSLLLGVGPGPDGTLNDLQVKRLEEIGQWLAENGEAIYGSRSADVYTDGHTFFTRGKAGQTYAMVTVPLGSSLPKQVSWTGNVPKIGSVVRMLGANQVVKWKAVNGKTTVELPDAFLQGHTTYPAIVFSFEGQ